MKLARLSALTAICLSLLFSAGCDTEHEKAVKKQIAMMNDLADELAKLKSNTDIVDAKPRLEKLGAKMKDQMKEMQSIGTPSKEEAEKLKGKYATQLERASARLQDELKRLSEKVGFGAPMQVMEALKMDPSDMRK